MIHFIRDSCRVSLPSLQSPLALLKPLHWLQFWMDLASKMSHELLWWNDRLQTQASPTKSGLRCPLSLQASFHELHLDVMKAHQLPHDLKGWGLILSPHLIKYHRRLERTHSCLDPLSFYSFNFIKLLRLFKLNSTIKGESRWADLSCLTNWSLRRSLSTSLKLWIDEVSESRRSLFEFDV